MRVRFPPEFPLAIVMLEDNRGASSDSEGKYFVPRTLNPAKQSSMIKAFFRKQELENLPLRPLPKEVT